jgi:spermidine dehydrogenase
MTFADFETNIRGDLDRMLGPGGFSLRPRHRGDHGQSLVARLFLRGEFPVRWSRARGRDRAGAPAAGRVAIANSDAAWDAYAHSAIDEADRAVRELLR